MTKSRKAVRRTSRHIWTVAAFRWIKIWVGDGMLRHREYRLALRPLSTHKTSAAAAERAPLTVSLAPRFARMATMVVRTTRCAHLRFGQWGVARG